MDPFRVSTMCMGFTFDGQHVWFASGDRLNAFDPAEREDRTRDRCRRGMPETAFDGQHLFSARRGIAS